MKHWIFFIGIVLYTTWGVQAQRPNIPGMSGMGSSGGFGSSGGQAKIDDSTKVIYGPHTAQYFLEEDVFNNNLKFYRSDTSYDAFHRYNFIQKADFQLTDLGNLGTATRWVFYRPAELIGTQFGFEAYTPYAYRVQNVKYYDTKSPYTNLYLLLGGRGQNIVRFDHSQNITPRFNLGIMAQRFTTNKYFGTDGSTGSGNNLTQNWGFVLQGSYRSKNNKYIILGQFNHLNHSAYEQGGMRLDSLNFKKDGSIEFDNPSATLTQASYWERRNKWHIYQQYILDKGFQLYHKLDYAGHRNIYTDADAASNTNFYPVYYDHSFLTDTLRQKIQYLSVSNNFGIKGQYKGFNYRTHYRLRWWGSTPQYELIATKIPISQPSPFTSLYTDRRLENFIGGWLGYYLKDSLQRVTAEMEYLLGRKDINLKADIVSNWFSASYQLTNVSPTFAQQLFNTSNQDFGSVFSNQIFGEIYLKAKNFRFTPSLQYTLLKNYIYFDTAAIVRQFTTSFSMFRIGTKLEWRLRKFQVLSESYYTINSNDKILRMPKFFSNLRIAYDFIYAKVLFLQIGTELHYKSRYFADAYMPLSQQFHLQNDRQTEGVVYTEAFVNARINRVRLFFKVANALNSNFFGTPYYPMLGRSLGFGVNWPLFD